MKTTIVITWWENEGQDSIPENVQGALEENALEQITKQRKDWYTGGRLYAEVDDVQYNGMWEVKII